MAQSAVRLHRIARLAVTASLLLASVVVGTRVFTPAASARRPGLAGRGAPHSLRRWGATRWIAGWSASPLSATPRIFFAHGFEDQTVRNIVFTSTGGSVARVRFSNVFGQRPLDIGRAVLGRARDGARVAPRANTSLTFGGRPSVVIPPGASVVSDRVRLRVRPLERLAVSVFLPYGTQAPTGHWLARQTNYVAAGNHALDSTPTAYKVRTSSWYFVTGVDVLSSAPHAGTLVAFGDSITDGARSHTDADARWPNDLARRLDSVGRGTLSIVDAGISGNRMLSWSRCCGASGLDRFGRDVLSLPSVTEVIVLEGVNDIGVTRNVSAEQIIAGYRRLIALARGAGLKIFGGTLTPFKGAGYWTRIGEAKREVINAWIRHTGGFDGVIDFASAVADPHDPEKLAAAYDSGDHLHPTDAGYQAMARVVSLSMLLRAAR